MDAVETLRECRRHSISRRPIRRRLASVASGRPSQTAKNSQKDAAMGVGGKAKKTSLVASRKSHNESESETFGTTTVGGQEINANVRTKRPHED